ncbi:MAG: ABC transporter permease [Chloroflexi bacterium]|nr:ABC transporter permease [Chloroflexota bacterium]
MAEFPTEASTTAGTWRVSERPWFWRFKSFVRTARAKPLGTIGGLLVLIMVVLAIFAPQIAPHAYDDMAGKAFDAPSWAFPFGTDRMGRDMLSRIIYGARISIFVGLVTVALSTVAYTAIGVVSAYAGGKVDLIIQRFVDAWMAFPWLVFVLTIVAILGHSLANVIFAMVILFSVSNSRVIRGATLSIKENQYIEAARAVGVGTTRILWRHILPNISAPIMVLATIGLGNAILVEASLSFLGFGVPPPYPTWGAMLSGENLRQMEFAPWTAISPGVALSLAVFGFNMLGDALRDVLDPRLRGSGAGGFR